MRVSACAALAILAQPVELAAGGFPFFDAFMENAPPPAKPIVCKDIDGPSEPAAEIVGGTIDAFLQKSDISCSERRCLSNGASQFATSLTDACDEALKSYKALTGPPLIKAGGGTPGMVVGPAGMMGLGGKPGMMGGPMGASTASVSSSRRLQITEVEETLMSIEFIASLSNLYKTQAHVAKACLKDDVVNDIEKVSDHLTNVTYVGERLVGNGMDIVSKTSKAFTNYDQQNYRAFGKDMGTVWRELLLAKSNEGGSFRAPSTDAIQEATDGLFSSLLGRGFTLHVSSDAFDMPASPLMGSHAPSGHKELPPLPQGLPPALAEKMKSMPGFAHHATGIQGASQNPINPSEVDVDLHDCVVENMPLWKSAWTPVFEFASDMYSASGDPPSPSDLMRSFMDVQMALRQCDISPSKEAMLFDTFESGGKFNAKLDMPDEKVQTGAVPSYLSTALDDFKERNWHGFGSQLGKAMQSMVVTSFPQEYEIDDTGRLHKIIIEATEMGHTSTVLKKNFAVAALFGLVSIVFSALVLLAAIRSRTSVLTMARLSTEDYDLEAIVE